MNNSEEISAKEALEMIIRGQIGELLFRRIKVEPDWADVHWRAVDTLRDRGAKTEVLCSDGEWRPYVGFVGSAKQLGELGMGNKLRYRVDQNTIHGKARVSRPAKSIRDKVDARVSATVIGGAQMADPKDWFFALIDVLDEEQAQSGQSRPVGKDRGIE